jgi:transcriptional regulator with XRE-family HTH domain
MGVTLGAFGIYLRKHHIDYDEVARTLHKTRSYVSMLAHGKATPAFRLAYQIERWLRERPSTSASPFTMQAWFE